MKWTDEYWPLVIQLYQKSPTGIKPMYSRDSVNLALELHIPPKVIYQKMFSLRQQLPPSLKHLFETLTKSQKRLNKVCTQLRSLNGMGNASEFFDDVEIQESFEKDFRPVNARTAQMMGRPLFTPIMLIMILDLYFRLIPATMKADTPDIKELASLLDISSRDVVEVLEIYQYCDPFIPHTDSLIDPLLPPCHAIWQRYANEDPTVLSDLAHQLHYYWK